MIGQRQDPPNIHVQICLLILFECFSQWKLLSMKIHEKALIHENMHESVHASEAPGFHIKSWCWSPPLPYLIHHACISHCCHHPTPPQASNWNLLITDLTLYIQPEAFSVHLMWTISYKRLHSHCTLHNKQKCSWITQNYPILWPSWVISICLFVVFIVCFFVAKFRIVLNGYCGITTSWVSVDQTAKKL